jgi:STE24 endopeptidase
MNESRAARHQRQRRRATALRLGAGIATLAALAWTPAGPALADWSVGTAGGAAPFLFGLVAAAAWELAMLAARVAAPGPRDPDRDRSRARASNLGSGAASIAPDLIAVALVTMAASAAAYAVLAVQWAAGGLWWLLAASAAAAVEAAVLFATPAILARLSGARPLARPALVERLGELARRVRVPIADIEEVPAGAALTSTALVAGSGEARRIFISSDLLRDWHDEEIAVVVAHEMAHHAHHDLWRTLALDAVILAAAFGAAAAWGPIPAAAGAALTDPVARLASLPGIALIVALVWTLATPLRLALSRRQERHADAFALSMTGSVGEFQAAIRRLAAEHLAEERPNRLTRWWYHRHPTAAERLQAAETFAARADR